MVLGGFSFALLAGERRLGVVARPLPQVPEPDPLHDVLVEADLGNLEVGHEPRPSAEPEEGSPG